MNRIGYDPERTRNTVNEEDEVHGPVDRAFPINNNNQNEPTPTMTPPTPIKAAAAAVPAIGTDASRQDFINVLNTKLASVPNIPSTFEVITYPPGFNYGIGPITALNLPTLQIFDQMLELDANGYPVISPSTFFSNTYLKIINSVSYVLSKADQATLNDPMTQTQVNNVLSAAVLESYVGNYASDFKNPKSPTYIEVQKSIMTQFYPTGVWSNPTDMAAASKLLSKAGYPNLANMIAAATAMAAPAQAIYKALGEAQAELDAAQANCKNPSSTNGGLPTNDATQPWYVGFSKLPSGTTILNGLNGSSKITVGISASNFTSTQTNLSVDGKVGFTIPILDVLDIGFSGKASYKMDKYTSAGASVDMQMEFTGITVVEIDPMSLSKDYTSGWYDSTIIQQIAKSSLDPTVTGFKLPAGSPYLGYFGLGQAFSRMQSIVISNYPTVTLTFSNANSSAVTTDFQVGASLSLKLFDVFPLGSASGAYAVKTVNTNAAGTQVTVVMAGPATAGAVPLPQQVCNVLGGAPQYPA